MQLDEPLLPEGRNDELTVSALRKEAPFLGERLRTLLPAKLNLRSRLASDAVVIRRESLKTNDDAQLWTLFDRVDHKNGARGIGFIFYRKSDQLLLSVSDNGGVHSNAVANHFLPNGGADRLLLWARLGEPASKGLQLSKDWTDLTSKIEDKELRDLVISKQLDDEKIKKLLTSKEAAGLRCVALDPTHKLLFDCGIGVHHGVFTLDESRKIGELSDEVLKSYQPSPANLQRETWRGSFPSSMELLHSQRNDKRLQESEAALHLFREPDEEQRGPFDGLEGDPRKILAEAESDYVRRRKQFKWRQLLPPERGLKRKAKAFREFVNAELLDLHLPERALHPTNERPLPPTARIQASEIYPGFDLIEVTERVGGRNRTVDLLWAPDAASIPTEDQLDPKYEGGLADPFDAKTARLVCPLMGLDGKSYIFHALNARLGAAGRFQITKQNVRAFVTFFCTYVHGAEGAFSVIEDVDELPWRGFYDADRGVLAKHITPMRIWDGYVGGMGEGSGLVAPDSIYVDATVNYAGALFHVLFAVTPAGKIGMIGDQPLARELPIRNNQWNARTRFLLSTFPEVIR